MKDDWNWVRNPYDDWDKPRGPSLEEQCAQFEVGDEVAIRPVEEWVWQVAYPTHIEGARGTIVTKQTTGHGRLGVQFCEEDYVRLGLAEAIPSYLWDEEVPRMASLRPRQIEKITAGATTRP